MLGGPTGQKERGGRAVSSSQRMSADCRAVALEGCVYVCVCVLWGGTGTVDCVKPMNKSVVFNSIWITAGGGEGGWISVFPQWNEWEAAALQLHYLTDNSHSTDGRVWLKKVSALVKEHAAHRSCHRLWQVVWSLLHHSALCLSSTECSTLCVDFTGVCRSVFTFDRCLDVHRRYP